jgi:large subunit ribosomal protein L18
MSNIKVKQREKRRKRVRSRVTGTLDRPRLSVYRSNKHVYAQIINEQKGITLASANDKELSDTKNQKKDESKITKKDLAFTVGELLAAKSLKKKIKRVVFDRGGYRFHGRVSSLAQGARKGGLEF